MSTWSTFWINWISYTMTSTSKYDSIFFVISKKTIINVMLNDMNEFKHDWWIKTTKLRDNINNVNNNQNLLFKQNVKSQNQFDQYINNRQSQFQRQSFQNQSRYQNNVYQNYQFSQQFRQNYSQQFRSNYLSQQNYQQIDYQQQSMYQQINYQQSKYQFDYKSNDYQSLFQTNINNQKNQYSNARVSSSSNQLQLIVNSNDNAFNSNQQSRQFFKSINNNQSRSDFDNYFSRFQIAYQINVSKKMNENVNHWT